MDMNEFLGGKWMGVPDVDVRGLDLQMVSVEKEHFEDDGKTKPVLNFKGSVKPLLLNKVNTSLLVGMFGPDSRGWIGRYVNVYLDPNVMMGAQRVGGVRVRESVLDPVSQQIQQPAPVHAPHLNQPVAAVGHAIDPNQAYAQQAALDARTVRQDPRSASPAMPASRPFPDDDIPF